jgi:hypothetical protein
MRTTITLDDGLLEDLKRRAAEGGSTLSRLIEDSLRRMMQADADATPAQEPFRLVTFGQGGDFSPYDVDKTSALLELEDLERHGPQGS